FDVHQGEFFGIVGRNGSGKSSLLKILASIYRADAGRVRMAGRVAPFIELGVGFNPELTARENTVLNGVLMGLTRREARRRLSEVIEFAELQDFADLKIKNYSSGMMVRLAFAIMVQADADIMLIDEVLAVGDAAFAQKCMDVFHAKRDAGKTIVLVTHDMGTVQSLCHRALLLHDGELRYIGAAEDAALRYYRLNFADQDPDPRRPAPDREVVMDVNVRVAEATLRDAAGAAVANVEQDVPIGVDVLFEAARELAGPIFAFHVVNEDGVVVFVFERKLAQPVRPGQRVRLRGHLENRLVAGRYYLDCWVRQDEHQTMMALQALRVLRFVVYGTAPRHGVVTMGAEIEPVLEG
ncbi:MAG TPA: ABC transporter ATP-binding protein, partial [Solirubrobacteraceae bacterium]|nr:ABC transporter ATP-binding protein [Solirubrobacteraceae bacterium]